MAHGALGWVTRPHSSPLRKLPIRPAASPSGTSGTGTNPEQLFAAGYSACFIGAIKAVQPAGAYIDRLAQEYAAARQALL